MTAIKPYQGSYYINLVLLHDVDCDSTTVTATVNVNGKTATTAAMGTSYDSYDNVNCTPSQLIQAPQAPAQFTRYYGDPTSVVYSLFATTAVTQICQMYTYTSEQPREMVTNAMVPKYVGNSNLGLFTYQITFPIDSDKTYNIKAGMSIPTVAPVQLPYSVAESLKPASSGVSLGAGKLVSTSAYANIIVEQTYPTQAFWLNLPFTKVQLTPYPFGFKSGRLPSYYHASNIPLSIHHAEFQTTVTIQNAISSPFLIGQDTGTFDTTPPFLNLFEIITSTSSLYNFTYRVTAGDLLSGIYSIMIAEIDNPLGTPNVVLYEAHAISGNASNGIFSINITQPGIHHSKNLAIKLTDRVGNSVTYKSGDFIGASLSMVPFFPPIISWSEADIESIGFTNENVDTSVASPTNTMYLLLGMIDPKITPKVKFYFFSVEEANSQFEYILTWVEANNRYEVTFPIPRFLSNDEVVFDLYADRIIPSAYFYVQSTILFKMSCPLASVSMLGPTISNIVNDPTILISGNLYLGWTITGDIEPMSRNYTVQKTMAPINSFTAAIQVTKNCTSQIFRIVEIYLTDGVHVSRSNKPTVIDPVMVSYRTTTTSTITTQCAASTDTTPPQLRSFKLSNSAPINVAKTSKDARTFSLSFETFDESGMKQWVSQPTVYIASLFGEMLKFQEPLVSCSNILLICRYNYTITIPYGWGSSDFFISIYGIIDSFDNFIGYTTAELSAMGQVAIIPREFILDPTPTPTTTTSSTTTTSTTTTSTTSGTTTSTTTSTTDSTTTSTPTSSPTTPTPTNPYPS
eukprot:gene19044-22790_t